MFLEPPTRPMSKFFDGSGKLPLTCKLSEEEVRDFVRAYRAVCKRDDRTCTDCKKPYLYQPDLRLGVLDDSAPLYAENNLQCLCYSCARKRDVSDSLTANPLTRHIKVQVARREGATCVYCQKGPIRSENLSVVSRQEGADVTDPNDWACCCKTCERERGKMTHVEFVEDRWLHYTDMAAYLSQMRE